MTMRKQLSPAENIYLRTVEHIKPITYFNNKISVENVGIVFEGNYGTVDVWIKSDEVHKFQKCLELYTSEDRKSKHLEPAVSREKVALECPVCGERVPAGIDGFRCSGFFIHQLCIPDLKKSIESTWDYSNDLLVDEFTSDDSL